VTITSIQDGQGLLYDACTGGWKNSKHNLLSNSHGDAEAWDCVRGRLIVGNASSNWVPLDIGTSGKFLKSNGADPFWAALTASDIGAASLTSTVYDDASTINGFSSISTKKIRIVLIGNVAVVNYYISGYSNSDIFNFTVPYNVDEYTTCVALAVCYRAGIGSIYNGFSMMSDSVPNRVSVHITQSLNGWDTSGLKSASGHFCFRVRP
jgi:hypothetical protein